MKKSPIRGFFFLYDKIIKLENNNSIGNGDKMQKKSIWSKEIKQKRMMNKMSCEEVDIVIIGGGITGVTLSYLLKDSNKKIVLVDQGIVGNNVTSRSTAKISFIQRDIYQKLEKTLGYNTAKKYYESQVFAIDTIKRIIDESRIKCDLEKSNSYLFTTLKSKENTIKREKKLLTSFGRKCIETDKLPIDFSCLKAFYAEGNYTFHPVKYLNGLINLVKDKVEIVENLLVEEIKTEKNKYLLKTSKGMIKSKQVVVANQYPFFIKPGLLPFKNYIQREYVNVAKYKGGFNFNAINIEKELHSIRFYKDYIIYVSNNHRITNQLDTKKNYQKSRDDFYRLFKLSSEYNWLNQDLMTNDHLPIIGEVKKNLYIATGYNAWGMTNGVLGASIIYDLLLGNTNTFSELVNPNRFSIVGLTNSIIDALSYIKSYVESPFHNQCIYIEEEDGIKYNVYIDKKGKKHRVKRKCPHLKCNLIFNEEELTWDCPCHGSRFDLDGNLLEGPSKKNIQ